MLPGEEGVHREVAAPGRPLLVLLRTASPDETVGSLHRGEDSDRALATSNLLDQALNAEKFLSYVRGLEAPLVLRRKHQHRRGIVETVFKNA